MTVNKHINKYIYTLYIVWGVLKSSHDGSLSQHGCFTTKLWSNDLDDLELPP